MSRVADSGAVNTADSSPLRSVACHVLVVGEAGVDRTALASALDGCDVRVAASRAQAEGLLDGVGVIVTPIEPGAARIADAFRDHRPEPVVFGLVDPTDASSVAAALAAGVDDVVRAPLDGAEAAARLRLGCALYQARVAMAREHEHAQLLSAATNDLIYDWSMRTGSLVWSERMTHAHGYAPEEVEDSIEWWTERIHPQDRPAVEAALARSVAGGGAAFTAEYRFRRADGSYADVLDRGFMARDDAGRAMRMIGSLLDLTERKRLEQQLREARQLEAVGRLAGGVAHDFNNLLTTIRGHADLLQQQASTDPEGDLAQIVAAAERAAQLTRELLAFSRKQLLQTRLIDINELVRDGQSMFAELLGESIRLVVELDEEMDLVQADPAQLRQVLVNLVENARDAMPEGGTARVATAQVDAADVPIADAVGRFVRVRVQDDGVGMSGTTLEHIFEPFFTTKSEGGAGLGLATVHGTVAQSGGTIAVTSAPGGGACFDVYLPVAQQDRDWIQSRDERVVDEMQRDGPSTVLLVEDEASVRKLCRRILEGGGFNVLEAADGHEALAVAARHAEPIDLLLTDVVMPEMSGREVADALTMTRPTTRVLYMSGYTEDAIVRHGVLQGGVAFLPKPFSPSVLIEKVREVLRG